MRKPKRSIWINNVNTDDFCVISDCESAKKRVLRFLREAYSADLISDLHSLKQLKKITF